MNAQTAYATITQMSLVCQVMSLPVSQGEQEHAETDPHVHGEGDET